MVNIDEQTNGLLINSENFQALELLQEKYKKAIGGIYIDPPYNTNASEIIYRNGYKNSSWISMIYDRLLLGKKLLSDDCMSCTTIDDFQVHELYFILNSIYGKENFLGTVIIKNNPQGRSSVTGFQISHEYGLFFGVQNAKVNCLERNENQLS
jgi:adenine-specific DNA-methyltransferase